MLFENDDVFFEKKKLIIMITLLPSKRLLLYDSFPA